VPESGGARALAPDARVAVLDRTAARAGTGDRDWGEHAVGVERGVRSLALSEVRRPGATEAACRALATTRPSASLVLHVDVFRAAEMPAAYFPHADGLDLAEGAELLRALVADPRVRVVEVTEYATLRDGDRCWVGMLVDLLAGALGGRTSDSPILSSGREADSEVRPGA
jgi:arginase family enzyme